MLNGNDYCKYHQPSENSHINERSGLVESLERRLVIKNSGRKKAIIKWAQHIV